MYVQIKSQLPTLETLRRNVYKKLKHGFFDIQQKAEFKLPGEKFDSAFAIPLLPGQPLLNFIAERSMQRSLKFIFPCLFCYFLTINNSVGLFAVRIHNIGNTGNLRCIFSERHNIFPGNS